METFICFLKYQYDFGLGGVLAELCQLWIEVQVKVNTCMGTVHQTSINGQRL